MDAPLFILVRNKLKGELVTDSALVTVSSLLYFFEGILNHALLTSNQSQKEMSITVGEI